MGPKQENIDEFDDEKRERAEQYVKKVDEEIGHLQEELTDIKSQIRNSSDPPKELEEKLAEVANEIERYEEERKKAMSVITGTSLRPSEAKAERLVDELSEEKKELSERLGEIEESQERLKELEKNASALLDKSTGTALGKQFADRKSELESNLKIWAAASVSSILVLIASAAYVFREIESVSGGVSINLAKVALLLPVSVAVWFSVSNYSRQKKLMEEYEFKSRMALSIGGFREVLNKESTDDRLVSLFIISTMEKIFSNPQKNITENDGSEEESPTSNQTALLEMIRDDL